MHLVTHIYGISSTETSVMRVMKMGNIAPIAGVEPSCHSGFTVLTITLPRLLDALTQP